MNSKLCRRSSVKGLPVLVAAMAGLVGTSGANAQSVVEEIVVTAQKTAQSVDTVPVAVTALTGAQIRALGFQSTADVTAQVPNVRLDDTGTVTLLAIRGDGLLDFGDANESPVGLYFDDVYRGTLAGQTTQMFDIDRVEVLRGPQGTLYGRNTTAGLVNFISKKPTQELDGYAQLQYGSYQQRIIEAAIGGPLSSRVRGRLAVKYNRDNGWQDNAAPPGGHFALTNAYATRGQIEIDVTDNVTALTSLGYSSQRNVSQIYSFWGALEPGGTGIQCSPSAVLASQCYNLAGFRDPNPRPTRIYTNLTPSGAPDNADILNVMERVTWKLGGTTELTSISAYERVKKFRTVDEDSSYTGAFGIGFQFDDSYGARTHQFSQEFRLSGKQGRSPWNAGIFYYKDAKDVTSTVAPLELTPGVPDTIAEVQTISWASYVDVQPQLTDTIGLVGGVRFTNETKNVTASTEGLSTHKSLTANVPTGRIGVNWAPKDDVLAYASVSTGFKSGEFNTTLLLGNIDSVAAVKQESGRTYELGLKQGFFEHRLRLRSALFYNDIKNKQGVVIDSGSRSPATRLINFGDATVYGAEFELFAQPVRAFEATLGLGLLHTAIKTRDTLGIRADWGIGPDAGVGTFYPLNGTALGDAAPVTANGIFRYTFELGEPGKLSLQTDFNFRARTKGGGASGGGGGDPFLANPAYAIANVHLLWRSSDDRYYADAFAENVFNRAYENGNFFLAGFDYRSGIWGKPRMLGVKVGATFH